MTPIIEFLDPHSLEFVLGEANCTSVMWQNKTDGFGSIEIHIPKAVPKLKHGLIIHICRDIPEPYGIITCVKLKSNETVVIGSTLSRVFDWRYMQNDGFDVTLSTSGGIGKLICLCAKHGCIGDNDNDFFGKPSLFDYTDDGVSVSIEAGMQTSCLELMTTVAREGKYCFGCTVKNNSMNIFTYPYKDSGACFDADTEFSEDMIYTSACDSHRNVFGFSLGNENEGYTYFISSLSEDVSGTERRILNLGRFSSFPNAAVREKKLLLTPSESIEATVRLKYLKDFSLGDIITIKKPSWNFSKKLAVTSVQEVWEDKYSCNVTFGIPQETVYRKLLRIHK